MYDITYHRTVIDTKIGSIPNTGTFSAGRSSLNVGAIVGGTIGGSLAVIGGILFFLRRRSRCSLNGEENGNGWSGCHSRFQEMFTVHPFPFSTTDPVVQCSKLKPDIPRAQLKTGLIGRLFTEQERTGTKESYRRRPEPCPRT